VSCIIIVNCNITEDSPGVWCPSCPHSARVSAFTQEVDGRSERLVSIRGTNKQIGDALVVLGKQIACKRVSAPKKKKRGTAPSGPVTTAPGPLPPAALPEPSAPRDRSATPVVPSVRMASPDSMPDPLTSMDVDRIMALTGRQNSDWSARQRLELATRLWYGGVVVRAFDGWEVGETD